MPQLPELTPILPELVVVCLAMILLIYGVFRGDGATRNISWIAVLGLVVAGIAVSSIPAGRILAFNGQFVIDDFGRYMKWLVLMGSSLSIIMSMSYNERESISRVEFPILILFATLGMLMISIPTVQDGALPPSPAPRKLDYYLCYSIPQYLFYLAMPFMIRYYHRFAMAAQRKRRIATFIQHVGGRPREEPHVGRAREEPHVGRARARHVVPVARRADRVGYEEAQPHRRS